MKTVIRSKQDMISVMSFRIIEMRTELDKAGVPNTSLQIPEGWEHVPATWVRDAHKWLLAIYHHEWAAVQEVRELLPPDLWTKYEAWGDFEDLREMRMLRDAHTQLRKVYYNGRPDFFKKTKVTKIIKEKTRKTKGNNPRRGSRKTKVSGSSD